MKLELLALNGCKLELTVDPIRPNLRIGQFEVDGEYKPWGGQWTNCIFKLFEEPYEVVKARIKKFYEEENLSDKVNDYSIRKPGTARIYSEDEEWSLVNARVINCKCDDYNKMVELEIAFTGAKYKKNE